MDQISADSDANHYADIDSHVHPVSCGNLNTASVIDSDTYAIMFPR